MSTPAVSVIMPTFNGGPYLSEQIGSILGQSANDLELLIVDDGSRDASREIAERWSTTDPRVRLIDGRGANLGQKARLHELVVAARGALIAVADQDDVWHPEKLARLVAALGNRMAAFGSSWIIDGAGRERGLTLLDLMPPPPSPDDQLLYLFKPMMSAHAMLGRRELFTAMAFSRAHPFDWLLSLDAAYAGGLGYAPDAVTYHRIHDTNQSNGDSGRAKTLVERLAPAQLRLIANHRLTARTGLLQRLEHLSFSGLLDEAVRQRFREAHGVCVAAWTAQERSLSSGDRALRRRLRSILAPLARSPADEAAAYHQLHRMTMPYLPLVARQIGSAVRGPLRHRSRGARSPG